MKPFGHSTTSQTGQRGQRGQTGRQTDRQTDRQDNGRFAHKRLNRPFCRLGCGLG